MKKTILLTLGSLLLLSLALLPAGASSVNPDAGVAPAAAVTLDATCSQGASASLQWPLRPAFIEMGVDPGPYCRSCTANSDCVGHCSTSFAFCSFDLALVCGDAMLDRFCFC